MYNRSKKMLIVICAIFIGFLLGFVLGLDSDEKYVYREYTVLPGDTLWGILITNVDPNGEHDINKLIYATKEVNANLDIGNLEVGKKIKLAIPVK